MRLEALVETSRRVGDSPGRRDKAMKALEAHLTRSLPQNIEIVRSLGPLPEERRPPYLVQVAG